MIVTQAAINGEKHNFIIDSGCPILYLNSKYFRGNDDEEGARMSSSEDVNGKLAAVRMSLQLIPLISTEYGQTG